MKLKHINSKEWLGLLFAFLLTLFFLIVYILFGLGMGIFNSRSVTKSVNDSDYFGKVYADVNQRTGELLSQVGLPEKILSDVITQGRVHADGINYIEAAIRKEQTQQKLHMLHGDIAEAIREYILQEGSIQSQLSGEIAAVADAIEDEYRNRVQLTFVEYLMDYKEDYSCIVMIIAPTLILLIGILCYLLIRLHRYGYRGMRYIAYSLLASSILTMAGALCFISTRIYDKIKISPEYYQQFILGYVKMSITVFVYTGMMGLFLAMAWIALIAHMRNRILGI